MIRSRHDDRGATLLIVLFLITGIALVMGVVMTQVDTSVRATVALRDEASNVYGGDAAAQYAINELRQGTFNGAANGCSTQAGTTEALPNFYPAVNGTQSASVAIKCTPDVNNVGATGGGNSSPGSALLTLGTGAGGEDGIFDYSNNSRSFKVKGGIYSNSTINLAHNASSVIENAATNSYVRALGNCYGPGSILITGATTKICNYSTNPASSLDRRGMDPRLVPGHGTAFDAPAPPTTLRTVPACTGRAVYELQPGMYTDLAGLNALTSSAACGGSVVHFNPGAYYFNFAGAWTINQGWVIAGTPTNPPLRTSPAPSITIANPQCVAPGTASATTSSGVEFIFGGQSRMFIDGSGGPAASNGNVEICASNSSSGPPIAIYGLWTSIGAGAMAVPAESGCITATGYPPGRGGNGGDGTHCAVIQASQSPNPILTVHGTVYTPQAVIDMTFNNANAQYFQWGLVAREILIDSTGSAGALNNAVISVPDDAPAPFALPTYYYIDVYICPGQGTCSTSGSVALRAKVQLSPTPPTTVTVLSWSQR